MSGYFRLGIAALIPVIASIAFFLLERTALFRKMPQWLRQGIIGIVFGAIAVLGTEWGIPINGAKVNCRDAAPICAGLFFGGPAGIIAGVIGGVERWFAVLWSGGEFTRIACSVSTVLAGIFAALMRRYMFDNKKPAWTLAMASGLVMEVFHLTMVFLTNISQAEKAAQVVMACAVPMISFNGASVLLAAISVSVLSKEKLFNRKEKVSVTETIQRFLFLCVAVTFLLTSTLVLVLQNNVAANETSVLLQTGITDVRDRISETVNSYLLSDTQRIAEEYKTVSLRELAEKYSGVEINIVNSEGIITKSTDRVYIGYDMSSGSQSSEFMVLLNGETFLVQEYGPISFDRRISRKYVGISTEDGFIQIGYDAASFQKTIADQVKIAAHNYHVGKNGFMLIADNQEILVSAPDGLEGHSLSELGLAMALRSHEPKVVFTVQYSGEKYYCMYSHSNGYSVMALRPVSDAFQTRDMVVYVNSFMEILTFAALFVLVYLLIKRIVVNNIRVINNSLSQITGGDLNVKVNVRSSKEFASLSDDINATVDKLKDNIAEAAARIDKELEFARSIQESSLPSTFPAFPQRPEFDIYATMDTAKEVGGDFYDFYLTGGDRLYFLIADVSGKGIPAAMFMMRAKTQLKTLAEHDLPIDCIFTEGNDHLCSGNDAGMFVTAWMGVLNLNTGLVQFANAGHNPPIINDEGSFRYLKCKAGLVLAGMEGIPYKKQELQLKPGETIFLYTDGVTEATDGNQELFGEERLLTAMNACGDVTPRKLCENVKIAVDAFVGEAPQFDDITMVALTYKGPAAAQKE